MLSRVYSGVLIGIEALRVDVEVDTGSIGEPRAFIVGLPDAAVKESLDRVSSALSNSGYAMPPSRLTINLAPGNVRKEGPIFDLPIALGIISNLGAIPQEAFEDTAIAGELGLSGSVRAICGAVSLALMARKSGLKRLILPRISAHEAALVDGIEVYAADTLSQAADFLSGKGTLERIYAKDSLFNFRHSTRNLPDFADVKGQTRAVRAAEIAVAGAHNLLMIGSPGTGKSMIAKRIPSIMPEPSRDEFLEILGVYSASGLTQRLQDAVMERPFRSPHHTISDVGLIGGGTSPKPGEISLAHGGVLFLDELPEFGRNVLEVLRQPLEDGVVVISRAAAKITLPCRFMLVAAMNPCPCGYLGDVRKKCVCTSAQIARYRARISGPLIDRMDLHVEVPSLPLEKISSGQSGESSSSIKQRVLNAREIQKRRFSAEAGMTSKVNSAMDTRLIKEHCRLSPELENILLSAMKQLNLSARAWDRILKVSRTIADLDSSDNIRPEHLMEAINYRSLDKF